MNLNRKDVLYYAQKLCKRGILVSKGLTPLFKKVKYADEGSYLVFWVYNDKRWSQIEMAQIIVDIFNKNDFCAKHIDGTSVVKVYVDDENKKRENLKEMVNKCFKE